MSKKSKQHTEAEEPIEEVAPFEFPEVAVSIYREVKGSEVRYVLVEIGYDPSTGDTSPIREVSRDIREDIIDKFKQLAADKIIFKDQ